MGLFVAQVSYKGSRFWRNSGRSLNNRSAKRGYVRKLRRQLKSWNEDNFATRELRRYSGGWAG